MTTDTPTRGERNRNPGNLKYDLHTAWLGQTGHDAEGFCIFDAPLHGLRAMCIVLINYQILDGCKTLADVIARYAPFTENDTQAYLADVEQHSGIAADCPLDLMRKSELAALARAIVHHENGRVIYSTEQIASAANIAVVAKTIRGGGESVGKREGDST